MAKMVFQSLNCVTLKDCDNNYNCEAIIDFTEYDSEIVFETNVQIDGLKRGWTGDLFYHVNKGYDIESDKYLDNITYAAHFSDVLLARVTVSCSPGSCVVWKYTFLKD